MQKHKVLLASHHADRRGSAISMAELGIRLPDHGYEPLFVFSKPGPLADDLASKGFAVMQIKRQGLLRLRTIGQAYEMLREFGVALVHVNSAVPFSKYLAIAARLADIPVVWHIREPVEDKRMHRQRRWVRLLANRIIVLTKTQEAFFAAPHKTLRIGNGVDVAHFRCGDRKEARCKLGFGEHEFVFIQIGSIEPNKGQLRSTLAIAKLLPSQPHLRLLIVGAPVDNQEHVALRALVRDNPHLAASIRQTGPVADVRPLLWASDCLLLPSLRESFPRTIIEAMAAGLPVIATPVGAVEDIVKERVNGLLIPPGDIAALANAMREISADDGKMARLIGRNNAAAAEALYDMRNHLAEVTRVYDELLAKRLSQEASNARILS